jgi:hypothetical protein
MAIATMTIRVKVLRRTKFYDVVAAGPLIAWYLFCSANMLPSLGDQLALIKLFIRTVSSVLPATLVLSAISHISTLVFFVVLVVMFAVPRFAKCRARLLSTLCGCGRHLPWHRLCAAASARAFVCTLPGLASIDYCRHGFRHLCGACSRAFDQHPSGGSATRNQGALCPRAPSTLSWRTRRARRSCAAVHVSLGAVTAGVGLVIPTSADEIRGTSAVTNLSRVGRLYDANGPFAARHLLIASLGHGLSPLCNLS